MFCLIRLLVIRFVVVGCGSCFEVEVFLDTFFPIIKNLKHFFVEYYFIMEYLLALTSLTLPLRWPMKPSNQILMPFPIKYIFFKNKLRTGLNLYPIILGSQAFLYRMIEGGDLYELLLLHSNQVVGEGGRFVERLGPRLW